MIEGSSPKWARDGDDDLAGGRLGKREQRGAEAGTVPDLRQRLGVELVEVDDVEAARAPGALREVPGEVLVERAPATRVLAVEDAPDLERAEPAELRVAVDEEGRAH